MNTVSVGRYSPATFDYNIYLLVAHILSFGAHARMPLVDRISVLNNIPITFVYGDHDWMDPEGGVRSVENLRGAGNRHAKTVVIRGAGHHGISAILPPFRILMLVYQYTLTIRQQ